MTWKTATTVSLACGHISYYRGMAAPRIGEIVKCPYCQLGAIVKVTTTEHRTYKGGHRA